MRDEFQPKVEPSDALDALEVGQTGTARCSGCSRLQASSCSLRSLQLANPRESLCANHSDLDPKQSRHPLGPVFAVREGALLVLEKQPNTEEARRHLIQSLAEIDPASLADLTFRDRVAIWQARQLGDRGAFVHLDRLESRLLSKPDTSRGLFASLQDVALKERLADEHGRLDPSRISLPGRLLVLSALVVLGLAFWAQMELLIGQAESLGGARFPLLPVIPILVAVGYLRLGEVVSIGVET